MSNLLVVQEKVASCTRCTLRAGCEGVVVGSGEAGARVMVVAFQPDAEAELMGRGLVDRAGKHFRSLLDRAGLANNCYITHFLKCRGEPTPEALDRCRVNLWNEFMAVKPAYVLTLGLETTKRLYPEAKALKAVAGRFINRTWATIVPWYTPEYVLLRGKGFDEKTVAFLQTLKGDS